VADRCGAARQTAVGDYLSAGRDLACAQPYPQPPQDQPYPQPPDKPRRSRRWWFIGAAAVVVAVGVTLLVTLTGGGSSSSDDRYGQRVINVIRDLHICDNPDVLSDQLATCDFSEQSSVRVATANDEADIRVDTERRFRPDTRDR
jgi:hypothetical protein